MYPEVLYTLNNDLKTYGCCFWSVYDNADEFIISRETHPVAADYELYI